MRASTLVRQALVTLGLILVSCHVGESNRFSFKMGTLTFPMFKSHGSDSHLAPSPAPAQAPGPSVALAQAPGPSVAPAQAPVPSVAPAQTPAPSIAHAPAQGPSVARVPAQGPSVAQAPAQGPSVAQAPAQGPSVAHAPAQGPSSTPTLGPVPSTPGLQVGFYKGKCKNVAVDVEAIIAIKIQEAFIQDPTILPALLRMQFHDCFVNGCDASILIAGASTEMTAGPNLSVRGFEVIEAVKVAVEAECPGVVSCSDIIVVANKVLLKLAGGPDYPVETGRRDGLVSKATDVILPSPTMTVPEGAAFFAARNFTAEEMVVLLGCHAVGITHCGFFQDRLYQSTGQFDPLMDTTLRTQLMKICPKGPPFNNITPLNQDPQNNNTVDNTFYNQLILNRGILPIDQALSRHVDTNETVQALSLNPTLFNTKLASAMIKLQAFEVLTGKQGNIRKVCSKLN